MKKLVLIIILLFLVGCAGKREFSPDFHTGVKGLTLEFLDNAPPSELLDIEGNQFLVGIGLKNEGAEDIRRIDLEINSFKDYIRFIKGKNCNTEGYSDIECSTSRLRGKSFAFAEGEFYPLYLDAELNTEKIKKEGEGLREIIDSIIIRAIYDYGTTASINICINDVKEIFDVKKSCKAKTEILSGQGGPVAVTKVEYSTTELRNVEEGTNKNRIRILITFEDKGGREEGVEGNGIPFIKLEEISFSGYSTNVEDNKKIKCSGSIDNIIHITKDRKEEYENRIICQADIDRTPAYLTPLIIKFHYTYKTEKKKIVKIKKEIEEIKVTELEPEKFPVVAPGKFLVAIDAGHGSGGAIGGSEAGTSGTASNGKRRYEYEINWVIANKLISKLNSMGIPAFRTRDSTPNIDFTPRIDKVMTKYGRPANLVISIHANGNSNPSMKGVRVIYNTGRSNSEESKKFGDYLIISLYRHSKSLGYGIEDLTLRTQESTTHTYLSIVTGNNRQGYPPAVIVETGFMSNVEDMDKLINPAHQDLLVDVIVEAINHYMGFLA